MWQLIVLVGLTLLSSCGRQDQASSASSISPDGQVAERAAYPSVVAITERAFRSSAVPNRFCTGARIQDPLNHDPLVYTFLTASHCLGGWDGQVLFPLFRPGDEIGIFSGNSWNAEAVEYSHFGTIESISSFSLAGHSEAPERAGDIAVIRVRFEEITPALAAVTPAELSFEDEEYVRTGGYGISGLTVTSSNGFEVTDENPNLDLYMNRYKVEASGRRYLVTKAEREVRPRIAYALGFIPVNVSSYVYTKGIGMGDSGGPVFADETGTDETVYDKIIAINTAVVANGDQLHESLKKLNSAETFFEMEAQHRVERQESNLVLRCELTIGAPPSEPVTEYIDERETDFRLRQTVEIPYYFGDHQVHFPRHATVVTPDGIRHSDLRVNFDHDTKTLIYHGFSEGAQVELRLKHNGRHPGHGYKALVRSEPLTGALVELQGTCRGAVEI